MPVNVKEEAGVVGGGRGGGGPHGRWGASNGCQWAESGLAEGRAEGVRSCGRAAAALDGGGSDGGGGGGGI